MVGDVFWFEDVSVTEEVVSPIDEKFGGLWDTDGAESCWMKNWIWQSCGDAQCRRGCGRHSVLSSPEVIHWCGTRIQMFILRVALEERVGRSSIKLGSRNINSQDFSRRKLLVKWKFEAKKLCSSYSDYTDTDRSINRSLMSNNQTQTINLTSWMLVFF